MALDDQRPDPNIKPPRPEVADLLDLTSPQSWFPEARTKRRRVVMHLGPPDSAKTERPMQLLQEARSAMYIGSSELLARELQAHLEKMKVHCGLALGPAATTRAEAAAIGSAATAATEGDDDNGSGSGCWAAAAESAPLWRQVDVAVLDEAQLLDDEGRGWAWTRALLGAQARELHVCGPPWVAERVRALATACGDVVDEVMYPRRSELRIEDRGMRGSLSNVVEGDCLVTTAKGIFALRKQVESYAQMTAALISDEFPPGRYQLFRSVLKY
ncbi:ATP-dependent RNA helicase supv3l1, mitochondrial [Cladochytrium tenue]|nr:ATP-dependent RNA helicase supv3l1, mitochondrial [Cladochytrium tenue]